MPVLNCRHFNGYKPCGKSTNCEDSCEHKSIASLNVLLIHLGALGAVVRSTALLASIHRKYPSCRLIWVTDSPAHQILKNNPLIDVVYSTSEADILQLSSWDFEIALVVDKSRKAAGILKKVSVDRVYGFQVDSSTGAVLPATSAATELWEIGLSDQKKFFENQKTEAQMIHEALELGPYQRDQYDLPLSTQETAMSVQRKLSWSMDARQPIIGLNTGASSVIPAKKWTVDFQRSLIQFWMSQGLQNIVLLGGPEDSQRNDAIARDLPVLQSPTSKGLRDGLVSVDACDIVVSGDSLGMHLAIARKKFVVAWFGPTCAHEIDLFGRGEKIMADVSCGPCWKRVCEKPLMCYDQVSFEQVQKSLEKGISNWEKQRRLSQSLLSKQPFSETSF